jgi:L-asparaginase
MRKRVYIAYTGGTIGMQKATSGYKPAPGYLQTMMSALPELKRDTMPLYDIQEYTPLLDSSNMTPDEWLKIAQDVATQYDSYDGFVVLHGTDTMAYTASALPFMLQGIQKPVIITGAQIPLCEVRNDARENLITAMLRAVKADAEGFDAFDSPNFPALGTVGIEIKINWELIKPPSQRAKSIAVKPMRESRVAVLRLFPGIPADIVNNVLQPPIKGLVLESYGIGNGPEDAGLLNALKAATDRGVVIVNCTQCFKGRVNMEDYATGTALAGAGVISGYDMTVEAALTKMAYLFSRNLTPEVIKEKMQTNLQGELSMLPGG